MIPQQTQHPLVSIPNSLREQLERAQGLLDQSEEAEAHGDRSVAVVKAREAMRVVQILAQSSPQAAALILLADMGYRGFQYETVERVDQYQIVPRTLLGINIGQEVVNVPTITRRTVRGSIF